MRSNYSEQEILRAYNSACEENYSTRFSGTAKRLTDLGRGEVTRQTARHWLLVSEQQEAIIEDESELDLMRERRLQQVNNNKLRARERAVLDAVNEVRNWKTGFELAVEKINNRPYEIAPDVVKDVGTPCTVELIVSDWQIGKRGGNYNTEIAIKRMQELTKEAIRQIQHKKGLGYKVERIVIALIGDLIEGSRKHLDSGQACDVGTEEQVALAIEHLFTDLIYPFGVLGIPLEIQGLAGNHDWDGHGMPSWKAGRTTLVYPIMVALQLLCRPWEHVKFVVPEGTYSTTEFYGQLAVYEHGVGVAANATAMRNQKSKRAEQLQQHVTYFRMGDKHEANIFDAGRYVVNGSFFGSTKEAIEYSSALGYNSIPAQVMLFHVPRADSKMTVYDNFIIQLGHISDEQD